MLTPELRPCQECGTAAQRPPAVLSAIIDGAARARGWTDAALAEAVGISHGYAWRLRRSDKLGRRPSMTVTRRLVDALELTGPEGDLVIACASEGAGHDQKVSR